MNFQNKIPDKLEISTGFAVLIGNRRNSFQFSVLSKGGNLKPLSWNFDPDDVDIKSSYSYLRALEKILYSSLRAKDGQQYIKDQEIVDEIIRYETLKDSTERGKEAPLFRGLVLYMLKNTGIHVRDAVIRFNKDYSRHSFIIHEALSLFENKPERLSHLEGNHLDKNFFYPNGKLVMTDMMAILLNRGSQKDILMSLFYSWVKYLHENYKKVDFEPILIKYQLYTKSPI